MIDATLHTYAVGGTVLVTVIAGVAIYFADEAAGDVGLHSFDADKMVVIDAALAEKSSAETKQPQKDFAPPPEPVKEEPTVITKDENAKPADNPEPPKPSKPDDKPNIEDVLRKNRAADDEDLPVGKPRFETGRLDGDEVGFGDKTFGNRYLGELKSGLLRLWAFPEILDDTGIPIGCVRMNLDGTIKDVELKQSSGNPQLDDSVERALAAFMEKVNKDPKPLPNEPPDNDLTPLARMQLCWRLKV